MFHSSIRLRFEKMVSLFLAFIMFSMLFLSGCSGTKKDSKVVELTFFSNKFEASEAYKEIAKEFMKDNPGYKLNVESAGGTADYGAELRARQGSNSVCMYNFASYGGMQIAKSDLLDLSSESWIKENCNPKFMGSVLDSDGKIYGVPECVEGLGFLINRPMFEAAGVDVKTMYTYAGFKAGFEQLKAKIDSGEMKEKYPHLEAVYAYMGKENWVHGQHMLHAILCEDFKDSIEAYNSKDLTFKKASVYKELVDFLSDMALPAGKADKSDLNSIDYNSGFDSGFLMGKYAAIQQGTWTSPTIEKFDKDSNSNMMKDIEMIPYSIPDGSTDGKYVVYDGQCIGIRKNLTDEQKEGCKTFLKWLYCSDKGKKLLVEKLHYISPYAKGNELDSIASKDGLSKVIVDSIKNDKFVSGQLGLAISEEWSSKVVGSDIQKYLAGKMQWAAVVNEAKAKWTEIGEKVRNRN